VVGAVVQEGVGGYRALGYAVNRYVADEITRSSRDIESLVRAVGHRYRAGRSNRAAGICGRVIGMSAVKRKICRYTNICRNVGIGPGISGTGIAPIYKVISGFGEAVTTDPLAPWFTVWGVVPVIDPLAPAV